MTAERDIPMTLVHRKLAHILEKESNRAGLHDGWATVLIAAHTSIQMLADALDAHLATHDAVVSGESWRPVVSRVLTALDIATGDTDPNIDPDMTDDEVRDEYPEIWAMQQLSLLLANQPESFASRKVAAPDGWKLVPDDIWSHRGDWRTAVEHMCKSSDNDADDLLYWQHQLETLDRIETMLASQDEVK